MNERRSSYPTVALPTISNNTQSSASYYGGSANANNNLYYGGNNSYNNTTTESNGRLSPKQAINLRYRDGFAIVACLFLLRLAFTPTSSNSTQHHHHGGIINTADTSIIASIQLAFYTPYQSRSSKVINNNSHRLKLRDTTDNHNVGGERTARPIPLDIDGDNIYESLVVPTFLKRSDLLKERDVEVKALNTMKHKKKSYNKYKKDIENCYKDNDNEHWSEDGSWGLRILNLKPLHKKGGDGSTDDSMLLLDGPFSPRSIFLSPLLPPSSNGNDEEEKKDGSLNEQARIDQHKKKKSTTSNNDDNTYPIKLLSIQIPMKRTHLGEEEKSRQRHNVKQSLSSSSSGIYGKNSMIPPKDHDNEHNYDRTRHYFCGKDWHHASESCHKHCGSGTSSDCGEGETCYADTPCDVHIELDSQSNDSNDESESSTKTTMALTKSGTLPGVATVWSDGSVSLHVITADVTPSQVGSDGHRTKRAKQKSLSKQPELELRQLWRVYPLLPKSAEGDNTINDSTQIGEGGVVDFVELGITFESSAIYSGATTSDDKKKRHGDHGAILLGGRYTLITKSQGYPLRVSFHALDVMTGVPLWDLKGNHHNNIKGNKEEDSASSNKQDIEPSIPIIHTTSSARRRSHLPTSDILDTEFDSDNSFIEGDDVMTSEECMSHFRSSVLDSESGALPHEFWDDGEFGRIGVGRFDRSKRFGGKKLKALGKKGLTLLNKKGGSGGGSSGGNALSAGQGRRRHGRNKSGGKGATTSGGRSWQADLVQRAVPRRLIKKQQYNARHPHMGKPNVILFHGREGLAVLSLKNGRPVCHISLMDHSLYADMDADGVVDTVQVVTSPDSQTTKSSGVQSLIHRITKEETHESNTPTICHALVTSGLPPREEVFTAPLCAGGPTGSNSHLIAAPPLLLEGSLGYGNDVVFAMNNGVVVRYDFNGQEVWRKKGGLKDGTPSWFTGKSAFLGRVQFGAVREAHSSISASSHRNQHRPGSPVRPILLSGENGAALLSPISGKVLFSIVYPQGVSSQPLLADLDGDGTDDFIVVSNEAIWGYKVIVETDQSGGFVIVVVTLVLGVAISALINKANPSAKRSTD